MKYTRYNVRPKRKKRNWMPLLVVLLFCAVLGYLIIGGINIENGNNKTSKRQEEKAKQETNKKSSVEKSEIVLLQCGVFKVKENADKLISQLTSIGCPFIVKDNDMYKVYYGIYKNIGESDKAAKTLKENKIDSSKDVIRIPYNDLSMVELGKIIEAELDIINSATDPKIKSVKTSELKKWVAQLENIDEKDSAYKDVNELKKHINELPKEVDKSKACEMNSFIYKKVVGLKNK